MTLGDILKNVSENDVAGGKKNELKYTEEVKDGFFEIRLNSKFQDGYIETKIPYNGLEDEKNYCRAYFLSMVFNAAVHGMKRLKHTKNKNR